MRTPTPGWKRRRTTRGNGRRLDTFVLSESHPESRAMGPWGWQTKVNIMRGIGLFLLGIPLPIILLLYLFKVI